MEALVNDREMFDLLEVREVARADLDSQSSSDDDGNPYPTLEVRFRDQVERSYVDEGYKTDTHDQGILEDLDTAAVGQPVEEDEEAYTFRLFARPKGPGPPKGKDKGVQKVTLSSPSPASGEPGFVNPRRQLAYYFTGTASAEQAEQYSKATISSEQLLQGLKTRWPGFELPWRVTILKSTRRTTKPLSEDVSRDITAKRKRSGKKRRIAVRKKFALKSAMESAARQSQAEKEAAFRDQRTRKNREKKAKKRQKDKLKKLQDVQEAHDPA